MELQCPSTEDIHFYYSLYNIYFQVILIKLDRIPKINISAYILTI